MKQHQQKPKDDWKYNIIGIIAIITGIAAVGYFLFCLFSWISQVSDFLS